MKYNGVSLDGYVLISSHTASLLPEVEISSVTVPGAFGSRFTGKRYGAREITVKYLLKKSDLLTQETFIRNFAKILDVDEPKPLDFEGGSDCHINAIVSGTTELSSAWKSGGGEIVFYCPDPLFYSNTESTSALKTGSNAVQVGGSAKVWPVFELTTSPGVSYIQIANATNGQFVRINKAFDTASSVVIDCKAQRVTVNGVAADTGVTLQSDFFKLQPGSNTISMTNATGTMKWSTAWL